MYIVQDVSFYRCIMLWMYHVIYKYISCYRRILLWMMYHVVCDYGTSF